MPRQLHWIEKGTKPKLITKHCIIFPLEAEIQRSFNLKFSLFEWIFNSLNLLRAWEFRSTKVYWTELKFPNWNISLLPCFHSSLNTRLSSLLNQKDTINLIDIPSISFQKIFKLKNSLPIRDAKMFFYLISNIPLFMNNSPS